MRYSKYQKAIFNWIDYWRTLTPGFEVSQKRHLKVEAVAGSGKTSTIVKAAEYIPASDRAIFLAFNTHIAEELKRRLPPHVWARTTHSLGNRVCMNTTMRSALGDDGRRGSPTKNKTSNILKEMQLSFLQQQTFPQVRKMVAAAKSLGLVPYALEKSVQGGLLKDTTENWQEHILDHFGIVFDEEEQQATAIDLARQVLKISINTAHQSFDYDDMLYMPIVMRWAFPKFKWVIVDEAQDINVVQREIVKRTIASDGHVIALGDSRQSIYGFRGADSQSMENIRKEFNADVLPLSICYRCSKEVVREARRIVPQIEYHDDAPDGSVTHSLPAGVKLSEYFTPDVSVLCPFNAPLVEFAFRLLKERIAVRVLGRDLGGGVIKSLKKLNAINVADAIDKANESLTFERSKIDPEDEDKLTALQDRYDVLNLFLNEAAPNDSIESVVRTIETLFATDKPEPGILTLSTIHKAKGLEWNKVVLIDSDILYCSTRKGKPISDWEMEQRMNLLYVGQTRAKIDLVYVTSDELRMVKA